MYCFSVVFIVFFFKQKTAYEMRISDWSSDVCSSDLFIRAGTPEQVERQSVALDSLHTTTVEHFRSLARAAGAEHYIRDSGYLFVYESEATFAREDRKSVGEGKSVSVRVDIGGRRHIKKNQDRRNHTTK